MSQVLLRALPAIVFIAWVQAGLHAQADAARSGSEIYALACVNCHGVDGRGAPRSSVGFDVEVPDFTDCSFSSPEADADWHTVIEFGGPVRRFNRLMPAFKDALTSEEIDRVIGYLRGFCPDPAWPLGDLNLPRPFVTEKAFPENEAVITTSVRGGAGRSVSNNVVYEHRVGTRGQYELVIPFDLQHTEPGGWERGLGDVGVAYKHVLFADARAGSILSAGGEVALPTGKEASGLGDGVTVLEPFVAFGQILPSNGFLHVHAGLERSTNHDRKDDETFVRAAFGRSFEQPRGGRIWSPMIEMVGSRDLGAGEGMTWDTVPQVQITLNQRQHLMINLGVRLPVNERGGRRRTFLAYFLWDWFDGGLLEGW